MTHELKLSYALCRRMARRSASNFYYSFFLLPRLKRQSMCALYAFLRRTDDLGDGAEPREVRRQALQQWKLALGKAVQGEFADPILPALIDTVTRCRIPLEHLLAAIEGVETDLDRTRYDSYAQLEEYCYRVASVVGLACIHIWGFRDAAALEPARQCGLAFQMTNILRDLKEDAARGRVYLPQEDLRRFEYSVADLENGVRDERFCSLMQFEIARTETLYDAAAELPRWLDPEGRRVFSAMTATYRGLLEKIKRLDGDVLSSRVRLSRWHKAQIATRSFLFRSSPPQTPRRSGAAGK